MARRAPVCHMTRGPVAARPRGPYTRLTMFAASTSARAAAMTVPMSMAMCLRMCAMRTRVGQPGR